MNYNKKSVEDIDVAGKRVLCRCDFNVPTKDGKITSDKRIVAALPTIQYLVKHNARVILCSHMGKPKGEVKPELSLQVVADRLSELLGQPVKMAKDVVGESAQALAASLKDGEVMLLENTRFEKGETKNDPELSKKLASMADIFVNDAFGTAHRAHASTAGVADYLPAVCGYLVQKEVSIMGKALADPERPFVAILGGAKVSDKLNVINNLLEKVDTLIIGGGMAYTFVAAKGYGIGKSLFDAEKVDYCKDMMKKAEEKGVKLLLPIDTVVAADFPNPIDGPVEVKTVPVDQIPADMEGLDIGEKTRELFADAVKNEHIVEKTLREAGVNVTDGSAKLPSDKTSYSTYASDGTTLVKENCSFNGTVDINGAAHTWSSVLMYDYSTANASGNLADTVRIIYIYINA